MQRHFHMSDIFRAFLTGYNKDETSPRLSLSTPPHEEYYIWWKIGIILSRLREHALHNTLWEKSQVLERERLRKCWKELDIILYSVSQPSRAVIF